MATSIISAGDAANLGVQTTGGDDGVLVLRSGAAGAKVDALSIAAVGTGAFVGEVTATGFTGTLDGVLGGGTPAAATVTTLAASGDLTANNFAGRNRIINGAMTIDQRNAGASVTPTNAGYTLDRWLTYISPLGKYTVQQDAGAVTPPVGFTNYLGVTSTSAYSVTSGDYFSITQSIEGYNVADLAWGTADAKTVTLSFWVYSSLTGTFGGSLRNSAANRSYPFTYTILVADTWEQKSITVSGDTTGTWLTTNGNGVSLNFGLGVGSTRSGTAGSWAAANYLSATGATSVVGTSGATFYITGVQLEKSSTATEFESRPYGTELALCQRYVKVYGGGDPYEYLGIGAVLSGTQVLMVLPISMRAVPSVTVSAAGNWGLGNATTQAVTSVTIGNSSPRAAGIMLVVSSGLTNGHAVYVRGNNTTAARLTLSAEL